MHAGVNAAQGKCAALPPGNHVRLLRRREGGSAESTDKTFDLVLWKLQLCLKFFFFLVVSFQLQGNNPLHPLKSSS